MPEEQASPEPQGWQQWALGRTQAVLATILTTVGSLGFVAFVGGALVWTHAKALDLPADQVVAVAPRRELVARGASALVLFVLAGIAAAGIVYLFDRYGRPSRITRINLLVLLAIELTVCIVYASPSSGEAVWSVIVLALVLVVEVGILFRVGLVATSPGEPQGPTPQPTPPTTYTDDWTGLRDTVVRGVRDWGAAVSKDADAGEGKTPKPEASKVPDRNVSFRLTTWGSVLSLGAMVVAIVAIALIYGRWWVVATVVIAFVLYLETLAVARASGSSFGGTAAAVLVSVAFFGGAVTALRYW